MYEPDPNLTDIAIFCLNLTLPIEACQVPLGPIGSCRARVGYPSSNSFAHTQSLSAHSPTLSLSHTQTLSSGILKLHMHSTLFSSSFPICKGWILNIIALPSFNLGTAPVEEIWIPIKLPYPYVYRCLSWDNLFPCEHKSQPSHGDARYACFVLVDNKTTMTHHLSQFIYCQSRWHLCILLSMKEVAQRWMKKRNIVVGSKKGIYVYLHLNWLYIR